MINSFEEVKILFIKWKLSNKKLHFISEKKVWKNFDKWIWLDENLNLKLYIFLILVFFLI